MKIFRLFAFCLLPVLAEAQISFEASREISKSISIPRDTRAVDMDGDGDLDVISREESGVQVIWWENNGAGSFSDRHSWTWGSDIRDEVMSLADRNGDGRADVWLKQSTPGIAGGLAVKSARYWVAESSAEGVIGEPQLIASINFANSEDDAFKVADMNGDGRPDLFTSQGIRLQNADGTFRVPPQGTLKPGERGVSLQTSRNASTTALGDLDGDGDLDVIFAWDPPMPSLRCLLNTGDGMLSKVANLDFLSATEGVAYLKILPPAAGQTRDRIVIITRKNFPDGSSESRLKSAVLNDSLKLTVLTDEPNPTGDEFDDMIWDVANDRLLVIDTGLLPSQNYPGQLRKTVTALKFPAAGGVFEKSAVGDFDGQEVAGLLADLDGDGNQDLLLSASALGSSSPFPSQLMWIPGDAGTFNFMSSPIGEPAERSHLIFAGDIDGDGDGDVVTTEGITPFYTQEGTRWIVLRRNQGLAGFERLVLTQNDDAVGVIAVEDLDGDGDKDILIQTFKLLTEPWSEEAPYGNLRIERLTQQADGSFVRSVCADSFSGGLLYNPRLLDWDRKSAVSNGIVQKPKDVVGTLPLGRGSITPCAFLGNPDGSFGSLKFFGVGTFVSWADLDRDGDVDLLWQFFDYYPTVFSFWQANDGTGEVLPTAILPQTLDDLGPLADIDGDGYQDFQNQSGYLLSRPGMTFEIMANPEGVDQVRLLDLDSDGDLDQVILRPNFGYTVYPSLDWAENNGSAFEAAGRLAPPLVFGDRSQMEMADIDGDGVKDLVVLSDNPQVRLEWFRITKAAAPAAFAEWMGAHGLKGNLAGPLLDRDGDGSRNWDEFVFGSDPAVVDPAFAGRPRLEKNGDGWIYRYQRRTGLVKEPWVETSPDLKIWTGDGNFIPPPVPTVDDYEEVRHYFPGDESKLFFRTAIPGP